MVRQNGPETCPIPGFRAAVSPSRLWGQDVYFLVMTMTNRRVVLAVAWLAISTAAASAAPPPKVVLIDLGKLPIVISKPYDPSADADAALFTAFARARTNGKRVLIDLGGNWCPDCIILSNIMSLPEVAPFIAAHYEVVMVDVGRFNRNLQIPARFGITRRLEGVPYVLIADSDGKLLNAGHTATLDEARTMQPQAIVD
jgi:thiol-disulfide isomerase/thioredoxin